jgi:hypothetical protein
MRDVLRAGADKVSSGTGQCGPALIRAPPGSAMGVVAIDARAVAVDGASVGFDVVAGRARVRRPRRDRLELLVTSIDRDGTKSGSTPALRARSASTSRSSPGGASGPADFVTGFATAGPTPARRRHLPPPRGSRSPTSGGDGRRGAPCAPRRRGRGMTVARPGPVDIVTGPDAAAGPGQRTDLVAGVVKTSRTGAC